MKQREIKFRAWDSIVEKMVGPLHTSIIISPILTGEFIENVFILLQYTGLRDKNGKEIYEGDLLKVNIGGDIQDDVYEVRSLEELYREFNRDDSYYTFTEVEIIGNIHENPELLTNKN